MERLVWWCCHQAFLRIFLWNNILYRYIRVIGNSTFLKR
jgi:hypothetical protein